MIFVFVVLTVIGFSGSVLAQLKIGYVNSQEVLSSFPDAVEANRKLEAEASEWQAELRRREEDLTQRQEQIEQQSMLLSDAKKQQLAEELQALYIEAQQYQNEKFGEQGEFFRRREELFAPVYDKINETIQNLGQSEGYDFIFDSIAGNLLWAKPEYDSTDKVLAALGVTKTE
jgi:outer membrane protein